MNYPPIFETCAADSAVVGLLSESGGDLRLYPAGAAPQGGASPYATWQAIGGGPENYLGGRPDVDRFALQVDVWASTLSAAREAADAVEAALETVAHVTAFRGEEKDTETALYRVGFDLEWFVGRASPEPAPVSSSSSQSEQNYPLDDDGTLAAYLGIGWLQTNAPEYLRADHTYTGDASNARIALPDASRWLTSQASRVDTGTILACEAEVVNISSASFEALGLFAIVSSGGAPVGEFGAALANDDGGTPVWRGPDNFEMPRNVAAAGARIGVEFNGNDGSVTMVTADGSWQFSNVFVPGWFFTMALFVNDNGNPPAGQTVSLRLIPHASDMALSYSAGAVDVFGSPI